MVYEISDDTATGALAKLVRKFKEVNPGVGRLEATCHDGSTVVIRIRNERVRTPRCTRLTEKR